MFQSFWTPGGEAWLPEEPSALPPCHYHSLALGKPPESSPGPCGHGFPREEFHWDTSAQVLPEDPSVLRSPLFTAEASEGTLHVAFSWGHVPVKPRLLQRTVGNVCTEPRERWLC